LQKSAIALSLQVRKGMKEKDRQSLAVSPYLAEFDGLGERHLASPPASNVGYHDSVVELTEVETAAHRFGVETTRLEIRRLEDVAPAFQALKGQADALYVVSDGLVSANRTRIVTFVLTARLPTIWGAREYVQPGGLLSYGASFPDLFRRAAEITDKILRGAKPADIPVEQPTKFDFVINMTTAKALGLTIPESLLLRADEVIE
jgi:putative tryptophan/tyrosine transport system substrate-binding protein